jgi:TrpR-related protein YerC/YecD
MNTKLHDENVDFLFDAILALETREEMLPLFEDLCTVPELKAMSQRIAVAKMLEARGRCTARSLQRPALPPRRSAASTAR